MDYTAHQHLEFRRRFFKLFGAEITIMDPADEAMVGFISMQAFKLREDIRVYRDSSKGEEVFRIKARSVLDFGGTYDILSGPSEVPRFHLRRKGLRSTFVRDHWLVRDHEDKPLAELIETSGPLALIRRYVDLIPFVGWAIDLALAFAPQSYRLADADGKTLATILRRKNPFIVKLQLDYTSAQARPADQFIAPALCALISVLETDK